MLEIIIAVIGSAVAGLWDLKTTEVPDEIPILMVASGLFIWFISALSGNTYPFVLSLTIGTAVLVLGLILYKYGKWGGADAWIFAAILYLIPVYNNKTFLLDYLPNLIWVSAAFSVIYAIMLGIINRHIFKHVVRDLRENAIVVFGMPVVIAAGFLAISYTMASFAAPVKEIFLLLLAFTIFWRYAKIIETRVFTRRIPAKRLRVGDVLDSMIWRGLTPEEVKHIKRTRKFVTIKEGMRFVPVFFIALIVTLLYGNVMFWFL